MSSLLITDNNLVLYYQPGARFFYQKIVINISKKIQIILKLFFFQV